MKYLVLFTLFFSSLLLTAQADCITGTIADSGGETLIGVSLQIVGTTTGTVTDIDGKFSICGLTPGTEVEVSITYTGFKSEKVSLLVGGKARTLTLAESTAQLSEVVVTGYRTQRKADMTGSVAGVSRPGRAKRRKGKRSRSQPISGRTPEKEPRNSEQYNKITANGFIKTKDQTHSTLSTDVDRAAYANVRRFLNQGKLPPADAVRTEEMINYFRYDDPDPKSKTEIALRTELMVCPWNKQNELLRVSARTMPIANADVPASNLVFLLDVSGSMNSANKLPLVKESLKLLTGSLRPDDKVSIVVYAGAAGLVLPATAGNDPATITAALDRLSSGGSTAGGQGIELAYKVATRNFIQGGNNRIILATDGDFNVGISDQGALIKLIEEKRKSGVYLTVLGFGQGNYQEGTMQLLADKGNGNHGYIDSPAEARKILIEEFGGTLYTVAKDVKLQLEFDPRVVASYRLIGYENRLLDKEDFDNDKKDAAEMGAGHNVTVLYEIIPANGYRKYTSLGTLNLRHKPNTGGRSKKVSKPVINTRKAGKEASNDLRWSAAVAEFAMLLRNSEHKGAADWAHCLKMATGAKGEDPGGYRTEMIGLIEKAATIAR